jgi:hypothetical protein
LSSLHSQFAAGFAFAVQRLRDRSRAAHLAQKQNFHFEISRLSLNVQEVANMYLAGWLSRLTIGLNSAQIASTRSQSARLVKSRSPQPFIDTNGSHDSLYVETAASVIHG